MDVDHELVLGLSKVQLLIDILLEASPEYPSDLLDTDPHPSDFTLALFAEGVYIDKNSGETDKAYEERLDLPEGWRLLLTGCNSDLNNGYFGAAFIHIQLQQVVVAHRGTDATKVGTLYTDFVGIFMNEYTNCMNSALTFTDNVRQIIDIVNAEPHKRCYNLTITGHSLGGWLSQVTAFTAKWLKVSNGALVENIGRGVHAKTVAFDSPGAKKILDKMREDYYTNYGTNILDRLDITTYVSAPNVINTCGLHLGTVYRVFIDFSKFDRKDLTFGVYNLKTHAISNFVEAFKTSTPNLSEVLDWAKDSNEYRSLFKDEILNLDNNFHVNFENFNKREFLDKIVKHYHVLPQSNSFSMHLNAFSERELHLLYQLIFFQMHQKDLKILNKFMELKNLVFKNDKIFPDFEINHANRTIKCQSKQMLEELIRRLKQLMRWLGPEFIKAVEEQIMSLPRAIDSFYRAEGESYLELLPRSILNFKDSLGLRDFLLSDTQQILSIISPDGEFEMCRIQNVFVQIKESVNASDPINKYTNENHYTFLDWPHLQKLFKIYGSPIDQNNLTIIDGTSPSTISSEVRNFLNKYTQCSPSNLKKLIFISSESRDDIFSSLENVKEVKVDQNIGLMDLSIESLETVLQRKLLSTGSKVNHSFQDFLLENCPISQINQFISSDIFKKIAFNINYVMVIKDTRPMIYDLQMPLIKTNIITNMGHVLNCANLLNTLVVISGLNRGDLEAGAVWEQLKEKIILAEGDAEQIFKYTCDKNQHKTIYLFEVSGDARTVIHCKQIFNRDFYVLRKFIHRTSIKLHKFRSTKVDDIFVCSEEDMASLLGLIETCEKREDISKNLQIAGTKEGEERVIQKYFNKNIHFVKIEQSAQTFKLEWRFSHGSVNNLLPCMSTDSFESIDELTLSQTERNLVILVDEPGMGKTTTLARLSRLIETSWVIHVELRQFTAHIDSLSDQFTPQNVAIFLLSQCCSRADDRLAHGLLEYFLQSKTFSKRVVLMFDGFDEIDDYIKNKDSSKDKLVKLFNFLQSKPAIQVFLTARKYLKESLETKLSQLSTSFVTIDTQEQQQFLFKFWRSFLPLELSSDREKAEGGLTEYAGEVLRRAKRVLGPDIECFMGVPLQLRMLAELFRPQSDLLIQPLKDLYNTITVVSAPNLYKMYVNLKYDIYLHDKTLKGRALDEDEILEYTESLNIDHGKLGFKVFFPIFYDQNFKAITDQKLVKLNRLGLVQSKGNGEYHFIHRTYAEYFCGRIVVNWLIHQESTFRYRLIKDVLLPKILLQPDSKVIRVFMNVELEEMEMSDTTLQSNAEKISQLWFETNAIFRNDEDNQTAVHIAVKEMNERIFTLLLSGLHYESTQEAFVSLITQFNNNNDTALHIMDQLTFNGKTEDEALCHRIIGIFFKSILNCPYESKEAVLLAYLFNRNISESHVLNYLLKSGNISGNTSTALQIIINNVESRLKQVQLQIIPFNEGLLENNVNLAKEILSQRLNNNIERYLVLLHGPKEHGTWLHFAAQNGHLGIVKLLAEQTSDLFIVMLTRRDNNKKTPLLKAVWGGHLDIVKLLVKRGANINTRCKLDNTALMYATYKQHITMFKYLIKCGAEISSKDIEGRTVLHIAVEKDNLSLVKYLIKTGAEITSKDNGGRTGLHIAAEEGHLSLVKYLIETGAEINYKNSFGRTVFHIAAEEGHLSLVKYLIFSGADINSVNDLGETALYNAAEQGHLPVLEYLLQQEADPNRVDGRGWTALTMASYKDNWNTVRVLLERVNTEVNADGGKAFALAIRCGKWSIVKRFITKGALVHESQSKRNLSEFKKKFPNYQFKI